MRLPAGDRAIVEWRKLIDYCLDPDHEWGGHKARVFAAALGITQDNAEVLREALLRAAAEGEAVEKKVDKHGRHFSISFQFETPAGQATVKSGWIIRQGEEVPRLVTCHVDNERKRR